MRNRISAVLLVAVLAICGGCSGSDLHKVKLANTDIGDGLSATVKTIADLSASGQITKEDRAAILPKIDDAIILSGKIEQCTKAADAANTLRGCVGPLITALQVDISPASIGVKSPGAQAILASALAGASAAVELILTMK